MPITLTSAFDLNQEVYTLIDNEPTKCKVYEIKWPPSTSLLPKIVRNDCIQYGLVAVKDLHTMSYMDLQWRHESEIGTTIEKLFDSLKKKYA
jgi:hypothetical protein